MSHVHRTGLDEVVDRVPDAPVLWTLVVQPDLLFHIGQINLTVFPVKCRLAGEFFSPLFLIVPVQAVDQPALPPLFQRQEGRSRVKGSVLSAHDGFQETISEAHSIPEEDSGKYLVPVGVRAQPMVGYVHGGQRAHNRGARNIVAAILIQPSAAGKQHRILQLDLVFHSIFAWKILGNPTVLRSVLLMRYVLCEGAGHLPIASRDAQSHMAQRLYAPFQQLRRRLALGVRKLQQAAEYDPSRDDLHGSQGSFLRSF